MTAPNSKIEENTLEPGKEYPPSNEGETIKKLSALLQVVHKNQPTGPAQRGQHPKQHGGVWATFRVLADLPNEMRVGIFSEPRSFTALIRFSNGGSDDDTKPAVHAMALKVLVPAESGLPLQQDFIAADHPVFFARDAQHMLEFVDGKVHNTLNPANFPVLAKFAGVASRSLLDMTYWSQTPYRLGSAAVKYVIRPSGRDGNPQTTLNSSKNALAEALTEQLTHQKIGADFELCVIPQTDARTMPVEDPTVEWTATPVPLARIGIYPQKFDSEEQMAFFANLSWSPWNSLPEHTPLGGINRVRQTAYTDSSALRHATTGIAPVVPSGRESF